MVDYSSKKQPFPLFLTFFFLVVVVFALHLLFWPRAGLHLDTLHGLFDVLQQRLVLRALVLVLVSVHVCQRAHISVKVLFVHWLLRRENTAMKKHTMRGVSGGATVIRCVQNRLGGGLEDRRAAREEGALPGSMARLHTLVNIMATGYASACGRLYSATPNMQTQERDG